MSKQIPIICDAHMRTIQKNILEIWYEEAETYEQALLQAAKKVVNNSIGFKIGTVQDLTTSNPWIEVWDTGTWTRKAKLTVPATAED